MQQAKNQLSQDLNPQLSKKEHVCVDASAVHAFQLLKFSVLAFVYHAFLNASQRFSNFRALHFQQESLGNSALLKIKRKNRARQDENLHEVTIVSCVLGADFGA